jgi:hypothetical protein
MTSLPEFVPQDNPLGEPQWSPALIEALHAADTCYIVESDAEADLLSRYAGLAPVWVLPYARIIDVPLELVKPIARLCVLSPGGVLDQTHADALYWHLQELTYPGEYIVRPLDAKALWQRVLDATDTRKAWRRRMQEQQQPYDRLPELNPEAEFQKAVLQVLTGKVKAWRPSAASKVTPPVRLVTREGAEPHTARQPVLRGKKVGELLEREFPEPEAIVPGVLLEGLLLLAGKPKLGKSRLMLDITVAVSLGGKALGRVGVKGGPVLYVSLEDPERRLQKRYQLLLADHPAPDHCEYEDHWPRLDEGGLEDLELWIQQHPGAKLIVIDTLKKIRR